MQVLGGLVDRGLSKGHLLAYQRKLVHKLLVVRQVRALWDGAVGLSRSLSRRAWVRADYRRERRNSELDVFDVTTDALTVQVGIGFVGSPAR